MDRYLKKKRKCGETAGASAVKKQSRPHYLPCPICSLQFSSSRIEAHAAQCMPRDALQPVPVPAQLKRPATNIKEAPSKKCAFSHLMKVAKVKPKPIRFEGKVDGNRFSVSWKHVDGVVDCAWRAKHLLRSKGKNAFDKGFCVKLCSHEPPASANAYAEIFSFAAVGLSVPVLKSCLQKAIRRQEVEVALRAAAELMKVSFREFIRRLTVIVLEDVMLRDSYPGLVWLLMADHKGFVPRREHVHFCLNAVRDLCECSLRDYAEMPPDVSPLELSALSEVTDDASKGLVGSLIVRSRYGGMSCDVSLLQATAKAWHGRLNEDCEAWLKRTKSDWSPSVMCRGFSSSPPVKPLLAGESQIISAASNSF